MTMSINPTYFTLLSALLFSIGMLGIFLNRRSIIIILMSIELLLLSVNINLVAFSAFHQNPLSHFHGHHSQHENNG